MPYMKTTANTPIPLEKREAIKAGFAEIADLIGKTEDWMMVDFCENSPMYFKGSDAPCALLSVEIYGAAGAGAYNSFTGAATQLLAAQLGVPAERIFVKYSEYQHWGWNGKNF